MQISAHLHLPLKLAKNRSDEIVNSFGVAVARCNSVDYVGPIVAAANAYDTMLETLRAVLPLLEQEAKQRQASGVAEYMAVADKAVARVKATIAKAEGWST